MKQLLKGFKEMNTTYEAKGGTLGFLKLSAEQDFDKGKRFNDEDYGAQSRDNLLDYLDEKVDEVIEVEGQHYLVKIVSSITSSDYRDKSSFSIIVLVEKVEKVQEEEAEEKAEVNESIIENSETLNKEVETFEQLENPAVPERANINCIDVVKKLRPIETTYYDKHLENIVKDTADSLSDKLDEMIINKLLEIRGVSIDELINELVKHKLKQQKRHSRMYKSGEE